MEIQAVTYRLRRDLYERLRREAFDRHTSQAEIVNEMLAARYDLQDSSLGTPAAREIAAATPPDVVRDVRRRIKERGEKPS